MQQCQNPRLSRFNKKTKDLLVDFINARNNRGFDPGQFEFGDPVAVNDLGVTSLKFKFRDELGWGDDKHAFTYVRQDVNHLLGNAAIVIHVPDNSEAAIINALLEQYGWLVEPEFVEFEIVTRDITTTAPNVELPGFDAEESDETIPEPLPPALDNRNYVMRFKPENLIYYGEVKIFTRKSIVLLGQTIDSLLDLRAYYAPGHFQLPFVDMFANKGTFYVTDEKLGYELRRSWEAALYGLAVGDVFADTSIFPALLTKLTGDPWHGDNKPGPFNLCSGKVIHNGFVSKDYNVCDPAFNYVLAVELGHLCDNLQGILKIAYRFSSSKDPGSLRYDPSSILPITTL